MESISFEVIAKSVKVVNGGQRNFGFDRFVIIAEIEEADTVAMLEAIGKEACMAHFNLVELKEPES